MKRLCRWIRRRAGDPVQPNDLFRYHFQVTNFFYKAWPVSLVGRCLISLAIASDGERCAPLRNEDEIIARVWSCGSERSTYPFAQSAPRLAGRPTSYPRPVQRGGRVGICRRRRVCLRQQTTATRWHDKCRRCNSIAADAMPALSISLARTVQRCTPLRNESEAQLGLALRCPQRARNSSPSSRRVTPRSPSAAN